MAAMAGGKGAAPGHRQIGDIEIRQPGHAGLVGQRLQIVDEVGVAVVAQPFGADHLITRPFKGQGYAVFQATGGITTDGFRLQYSRQQQGRQHVRAPCLASSRLSNTNRLKHINK